MRLQISTFLRYIEPITIGTERNGAIVAPYIGRLEIPYNPESITFSTESLDCVEKRKVCPIRRVDTEPPERV